MIGFWARKANLNWLRSTGLVLAFALLFSAIVPPIAEANIWDDRKSALDEMQRKKKRVDQPWEQLSAVPVPAVPSDNLAPIPANLGKLVDTFWAPREAGLPFVLHVQDAHGYVAAQRNLAALVGHFQRGSEDERKPILVAVEGAWRNIDLEWLHAFPNEKVLKEFASDLVDRSEITGEEFFAMVQGGEKIRIEGIEDEKTYRENVEIRDRVGDVRDSVMGEISYERSGLTLRTLQTELNALKVTMLPRGLIDLDAKKRRFEEGALSAGAYMSYLKSVSGSVWNKDATPVLKSFLEAVQMEAELEEKTIYRERDGFIKYLQSNLDAQTLTRVADNSLKFRMGRLSPQQYYSGLIQLADVHKVPLPEIRKYRDYLEKVAQISTERMLEDLKAFELAAQNALVEGKPEAEALVRADRWINLQNKLWSFEMAPADWTAYQEMKKSYGWKDAQGFLMGVRNLSGWKEFIARADSHIEDVHQYYVVAHRRDEIMVRNALRFAKENGADRVVLVAGGFHTPGIARILKQQGVSHSIIRPAIGSLQMVRRDDRFLDELIRSGTLRENSVFMNGGDVIRVRFLSELLGRLRLASRSESDFGETLRKYFDAFPELKDGLSGKVQISNPLVLPSGTYLIGSVLGTEGPNDFAISVKNGKAAFINNVDEVARIAAEMSNGKIPDWQNVDVLQQVMDGGAQPERLWANRISQDPATGKISKYQIPRIRLPISRSNAQRIVAATPAAPAAPVAPAAAVIPAAVQPAVSEPAVEPVALDVRGLSSEVVDVVSLGRLHVVTAAFRAMPARFAAIFSSRPMRVATAMSLAALMGVLSLNPVGPSFDAGVANAAGIASTAGQAASPSESIIPLFGLITAMVGLAVGTQRRNIALAYQGFVESPGAAALRPYLRVPRQSDITNFIARTFQTERSVESRDAFRMWQRRALILTMVLAFSAAVGLPVLGVPLALFAPVALQGVAALPFLGTILGMAAPVAAMPIVGILTSLIVVELAFQGTGRLFGFTLSVASLSNEQLRADILSAVNSSNFEDYLTSLPEKQRAKLLDNPVQLLSMRERFEKSQADLADKSQTGNRVLLERMYHQVQSAQRSAATQDLSQKLSHAIPVLHRIPVAGHLLNPLPLFYSFFFQYFVSPFSLRYGRTSDGPKPALGYFAVISLAGELDRLDENGNLRTNATGALSPARNAARYANNLLWRQPVYRSIVGLWNENVFLSGASRLFKQRMRLWVISSIGMGVLLAFLPAYLLGSSAIPFLPSHTRQGGIDLNFSIQNFASSFLLAFALNMPNYRRMYAQRGPQSAPAALLGILRMQMSTTFSMWFVNIEVQMALQGASGADTAVSLIPGVDSHVMHDSMALIEGQQGIMGLGHEAGTILENALGASIAEVALPWISREAFNDKQFEIQQKINPDTAAQQLKAGNPAVYELLKAQHPDDREFQEAATLFMSNMREQQRAADAGKDRSLIERLAGWGSDGAQKAAGLGGDIFKFIFGVDEAHAQGIEEDYATKFNASIANPSVRFILAGDVSEEEFTRTIAGSPAQATLNYFLVDQNWSSSQLITYFERLHAIYKEGGDNDLFEVINIQDTDRNGDGGLGEFLKLFRTFDPFDTISNERRGTISYFIGFDKPNTQAVEGLNWNSEQVMTYFGRIYELSQMKSNAIFRLSGIRDGAEVLRLFREFDPDDQAANAKRGLLSYYFGFDRTDTAETKEGLNMSVKDMLALFDGIETIGLDDDARGVLIGDGRTMADFVRIYNSDTPEGEQLRGTLSFFLNPDDPNTPYDPVNGTGVREGMGWTAGQLVSYLQRISDIANTPNSPVFKVIGVSGREEFLQLFRSFDPDNARQNRQRGAISFYLGFDNPSTDAVEGLGLPSTELDRLFGSILAVAGNEVARSVLFAEGKTPEQFLEAYSSDSPQGEQLRGTLSFFFGMDDPNTPFNPATGEGLEGLGWTGDQLIRYLTDIYDIANAPDNPVFDVIGIGGRDAYLQLFRSYDPDDAVANSQRGIISYYLGLDNPNTPYDPVTGEGREGLEFSAAQMLQFFGGVRELARSPVVRAVLSRDGASVEEFLARYREDSDLQGIVSNLIKLDAADLGIPEAIARYQEIYDLAGYESVRTVFAGEGASIEDFLSVYRTSDEIRGIITFFLTADDPSTPFIPETGAGLEGLGYDIGQVVTFLDKLVELGNQPGNEVFEVLGIESAEEFYQLFRTYDESDIVANRNRGVISYYLGAEGRNFTVAQLIAEYQKVVEIGQYETVRRLLVGEGGQDVGITTFYEAYNSNSELQGIVSFFTGQGGDNLGLSAGQTAELFGYFYNFSQNGPLLNYLGLDFQEYLNLFRSNAPGDADDVQRGVIFSLAEGIRNFYGDWDEIYNPDGSLRSLENAQLFYGILTNLGAIDGQLSGDRAQRDGFKAALARNIAFNYEDWELIFNENGTVKDQAKLTDYFTAAQNMQEPDQLGAFLSGTPTDIEGTISAFALGVVTSPKDWILFFETDSGDPDIGKITNLDNVKALFVAIQNLEDPENGIGAYLEGDSSTRRGTATAIARELITNPVVWEELFYTESQPQSLLSDETIRTIQSLRSLPLFGLSLEPAIDQLIALLEGYARAEAPEIGKVRDREKVDRLFKTVIPNIKADVQKLATQRDENGNVVLTGVPFADELMAEPKVLNGFAIAVGRDVVTTRYDSWKDFFDTDGTALNGGENLRVLFENMSRLAPVDDLLLKLGYGANDISGVKIAIAKDEAVSVNPLISDERVVELVAHYENALTLLTNPSAREALDRYYLAIYGINFFVTDEQGGPRRGFADQLVARSDAIEKLLNPEGFEQGSTVFHYQKYSPEELTNALKTLEHIRSAAFKWKPLSDNEVQYYYRLFYGDFSGEPVPADFEDRYRVTAEMDQGEREARISRFFEMVLRVSEVRVDAGEEVLNTLKSWRGDAGYKAEFPMPYWMTREDVSQMILYVEGDETRDVGGLMFIPVNNPENWVTTIMTLLDIYSGSEEDSYARLVDKFSTEFFINAIYMTHHYDEVSVPDKRGEPSSQTRLSPLSLTDADLSFFSNQVRNVQDAGESREKLLQIMQLMKYDGLFAEAIENRFPEEMAKQIDSLEEGVSFKIPGPWLPSIPVPFVGKLKEWVSPSARTDPALLSDVMKPNRGQIIGFATNIQNLQESGILEKNPEAVPQYIDRWIKDGAFTQALFWKESKGGYVLPFNILDPSIALLREGNDALTDRLKTQIQGRSNTIFPHDPSYRDLGDVANGERLLRLFYVINFSRPMPTADDPAWTPDWVPSSDNDLWSEQDWWTYQWDQIRNDMVIQNAASSDPKSDKELRADIVNAQLEFVARMKSLSQAAQDMVGERLYEEALAEWKQNSGRDMRDILGQRKIDLIISELIRDNADAVRYKIVTGDPLKERLREDFAFDNSEQNRNFVQYRNFQILDYRLPDIPLSDKQLLAEALAKLPISLVVDGGIEFLFEGNGIGVPVNGRLESSERPEDAIFRGITVQADPALILAIKDDIANRNTKRLDSYASYSKSLAASYKNQAFEALKSDKSALILETQLRRLSADNGIQRLERGDIDYIINDMLQSQISAEDAFFRDTTIPLYSQEIFRILNGISEDLGLTSVQKGQVNGITGSIYAQGFQDPLDTDVVKAGLSEEYNLGIERALTLFAWQVMLEAALKEYLAEIGLNGYRDQEISLMAVNSIQSGLVPLPDFSDGHRILYKPTNIADSPELLKTERAASVDQIRNEFVTRSPEILKTFEQLFLTVESMAEFERASGVNIPDEQIRFSADMILELGMTKLYVPEKTSPQIVRDAVNLEFKGLFDRILAAEKPEKVKNFGRVGDLVNELYYRSDLDLTLQTHFIQGKNSAERIEGAIVAEMIARKIPPYQINVLMAEVRRIREFIVEQEKLKPEPVEGSSGITSKITDLEILLTLDSHQNPDRRIGLLEIFFPTMSRDDKNRLIYKVDKAINEPLRQVENRELESYADIPDGRPWWTRPWSKLFLGEYNLFGLNKGNQTTGALTNIAFASLITSLFFTSLTVLGWLRHHMINPFVHYKISFSRRNFFFPTFHREYLIDKEDVNDWHPHRHAWIRIMINSMVTTFWTVFFLYWNLAVLNPFEGAIHVIPLVLFILPTVLLLRNIPFLIMAQTVAQFRAFAITFVYFMIGSTLTSVFYDTDSIWTIFSGYIGLFSTSPILAGVLMFILAAHGLLIMMTTKWFGKWMGTPPGMVEEVRDWKYLDDSKVVEEVDGQGRGTGKFVSPQKVEQTKLLRGPQHRAYELVHRLKEHQYFQAQMPFFPSIPAGDQLDKYFSIELFDKMARSIRGNNDKRFRHYLDLSYNAFSFYPAMAELARIVAGSVAAGKQEGLAYEMILAVQSGKPNALAEVMDKHSLPADVRNNVNDFMGRRRGDLGNTINVGYGSVNSNHRDFQKIISRMARPYHAEFTYVDEPALALALHKIQGGRTDEQMKALVKESVDELYIMLDGYIDSLDSARFSARLMEVAARHGVVLTEAQLRTIGKIQEDYQDGMLRSDFKDALAALLPGENHANIDAIGDEFYGWNGKDPAVLRATLEARIGVDLRSVSNADLSRTIHYGDERFIVLARSSAGKKPLPTAMHAETAVNGNDGTPGRFWSQLDTEIDLIEPRLAAMGIFDGDINKDARKKLAYDLLNAALRQVPGMTARLLMVQELNAQLDLNAQQINDVLDIMEEVRDMSRPEERVARALGMIPVWSDRTAFAKRLLWSTPNQRAMLLNGLADLGADQRSAIEALVIETKTMSYLPALDDPKIPSPMPVRFHGVRMGAETDAYRKAMENGEKVIIDILTRVMADRVKEQAKGKSSNNYLEVMPAEQIPLFARKLATSLEPVARQMLIEQSVDHNDKAFEKILREIASIRKQGPWELINDREFNEAKSAAVLAIAEELPAGVISGNETAETLLRLTGIGGRQYLIRLELAGGKRLSGSEVESIVARVDRVKREIINLEEVKTYIWGMPMYGTPMWEMNYNTSISEIDEHLEPFEGNAAQRAALARSLLDMDPQSAMQRLQQLGVDAVTRDLILSTEKFFDNGLEFMRKPFFYGVITSRDERTFIPWEELRETDYMESMLPETPGKARERFFVVVDNGNWLWAAAGMYMALVVTKLMETLESAQYFMMQAMTGYESKNSMLQFMGVFAHRGLWFTQQFNALLLGVIRAFGKYCGIHESIAMAFKSMPGYPAGFYFTRGYYASGYEHHWLTNFGLRVVHSPAVFQRFWNLIYNRINSEDEIMSASAMDSVAIWRMAKDGKYKVKRPVTALEKKKDRVAGSFLFQFIMEIDWMVFFSKSRFGHRNSAQIYEQNYDQIAKHPRPILRNVGVALLSVPRLIAAIIDDRPIVGSFLFFLAKKWNIQNEVPQESFKTKGKTLALSIQSKFLHGFGILGIIVTPVWAFTLILGYFYMNYLPGMIEYRLPDAAWTLSFILFGLLWLSKPLGPTFNSVLNPWWFGRTIVNPFEKLFAQFVMFLPNVLIMGPLYFIWGIAETAMSNAIYMPNLGIHTKSTSDGIRAHNQVIERGEGPPIGINPSQSGSKPAYEPFATSPKTFTFGMALLIIVLNGYLSAFFPPAILLAGSVLLALFAASMVTPIINPVLYEQFSGAKASAARSRSDFVQRLRTSPYDSLEVWQAETKDMSDSRQYKYSKRNAWFPMIFLTAVALLMNVLSLPEQISQSWLFLFMAIGIPFVIFQFINVYVGFFRYGGERDIRRSTILGPGDSTRRFWNIYVSGRMFNLLDAVDKFQSGLIGRIVWLARLAVYYAWPGMKFGLLGLALGFILPTIDNPLIPALVLGGIGLLLPLARILIRAPARSGLRGIQWMGDRISFVAIESTLIGILISAAVIFVSVPATQPIFGGFIEFLTHTPLASVSHVMTGDGSVGVMPNVLLARSPHVLFLTTIIVGELIFFALSLFYIAIDVLFMNRGNYSWKHIPVYAMFDRKFGITERLSLDPTMLAAKTEGGEGVRDMNQPSADSLARLEVIRGSSDSAELRSRIDNLIELANMHHFAPDPQMLWYESGALNRWVETLANINEQSAYTVKINAASVSQNGIASVTRSARLNGLRIRGGHSLEHKIIAKDGVPNANRAGMLNVKDWSMDNLLLPAPVDGIGRQLSLVRSALDPEVADPAALEKIAAIGAEAQTDSLRDRVENLIELSRAHTFTPLRELLPYDSTALNRWVDAIVRINGELERSDSGVRIALNGKTLSPQGVEAVLELAKASGIDVSKHSLPLARLEFSTLRPSRIARLWLASVRAYYWSRDNRMIPSRSEAADPLIVSVEEAHAHAAARPAVIATPPLLAAIRDKARTNDLKNRIDSLVRISAAHDFEPRPEYLIYSPFDLERWVEQITAVNDGFENAGAQIRIPFNTSTLSQNGIIAVTKIAEANAVPINGLFNLPNHPIRRNVARVEPDDMTSPDSPDLRTGPERGADRDFDFDSDSDSDQTEGEAPESAGVSEASLPTMAGPRLGAVSAGNALNKKSFDIAMERAVARLTELRHNASPQMQNKIDALSALVERYKDRYPFVPSASFLRYSVGTLEQRIGQIAAMNDALAEAQSGYRIPINTRSVSARGIKEAEERVKEIISEVAAPSGEEDRGVESGVSNKLGILPLGLPFGLPLLNIYNSITGFFTDHPVLGAALVIPALIAAIGGIKIARSRIPDSDINELQNKSPQYLKDIEFARASADAGHVEAIPKLELLLNKYQSELARIGDGSSEPLYSGQLHYDYMKAEQYAHVVRQIDNEYYEVWEAPNPFYNPNIERYTIAIDALTKSLDTLRALSRISSGQQQLSLTGDLIRASWSIKMGELSRITAPSAPTTQRYLDGPNRRVAGRAYEIAPRHGEGAVAPDVAQAIDPNPPADDNIFSLEAGWVDQHALGVDPPVAINGRSYRLVADGRPSMPYDTLLFPENDVNLVLSSRDTDKAQDVRDAVFDLISFHRASGIKGYINSLGIGALHRLHDHLYWGQFPMERGMKVKQLGEVSGVTVGEIENVEGLPGVSTVLESNDDAALADMTFRLAGLLMDSRIPYHAYFSAGRVIFIWRNPSALETWNAEDLYLDGNYFSPHSFFGLLLYPKTVLRNMTMERYRQLVRQVSYTTQDADGNEIGDRTQVKNTVLAGLGVASVQLDENMEMTVVGKNAWRSVTGRVGGVIEAQRARMAGIPNAVQAGLNRANISRERFGAIPSGLSAGFRGIGTRISNSLGRIREESRTFLSDNLAERTAMLVARNSGPIADLSDAMQSPVTRDMAADQKGQVYKQLLSESAAYIRERAGNVKVRVTASSRSGRVIAALPIAGAFIGTAGLAAWKFGGSVVISVPEKIVGGLIAPAGSIAHVAAMGAYTSQLDRIRSMPWDSIGLLAGVAHWQSVVLVVSAVILTAAAANANRLVRAAPFISNRFDLSALGGLLGKTTFVESNLPSSHEIGTMLLGDRTTTDSRKGTILVITSPLADKNSPDRLIVEGVLTQIRANPENAANFRVVYNSDDPALQISDKDATRKQLAAALKLQALGSEILQDLALTSADEIISGMKTSDIQVIGTPEDIQSLNLNIEGTNITLTSFKYQQLVNVGVEFRAYGREAEQIRALIIDAGGVEVEPGASRGNDGALVLPARQVKPKDFDRLWTEVQMILKQA